MSRKIFFVDIDNTLANVNAQLEQLGIDTSIYPAKVPIELWNADIFKYAAPIVPVINFVKAVHVHYEIAYLTARKGSHHEATLLWLKEHNLPLSPIIHTHGREKGEFVHLFSQTETVVGAIEDSPQEIDSMRSAKNDLIMYIPDWAYNRDIEGIRIKI